MQVTQKSVNRRERLARKQEEMKLSLMSAAWEHWRDCYLEERLRPIVRETCFLVLWGSNALIGV